MSQQIQHETSVEQSGSPISNETATTSPDQPTQWWLLIGIGGMALALDQITKWLVSTKLVLGHSWEPIPAIASLIKITYSYNSGAAFGMLPQASDLFLLLAVVTVIAFIVSYPRLPSHAGLSRVSIGLISGGALSNAIDRIRLGKVIDYVHVQLTPTFSNISNFADHAITVGVILLVVDQWLAERRHIPSETAGDAGSAEPEQDIKPPMA